VIVLESIRTMLLPWDVVEKLERDERGDCDGWIAYFTLIACGLILATLLQLPLQKRRGGHCSPHP
jgi:hypothetical protein